MEKKNVSIVWGVKIPMRDGIQLNATLYLPKDQQETLPVIFTLTPYISDTYHERGYHFAQQGYVFALVDCRGRGNSEGEFFPLKDEDQDGHDVVEWLAEQSYCDGQVTMWGGSYAGYNQWATVKEFPPHLKTIVPVASAFPGIDFPFAHNVFYSYEMRWMTFTSGVTPNNNLFAEHSYWAEKFYEMYVEHRPFQELDQIVGNLSTKFQDIIEHAKNEPFYDQMVPTDEQFSEIELPILSITGHYDGDQPGAMQFYKKHMGLGSEAAKEKHYLIIGPWDHPGTRTPRKEVGGLTFGDASLLDMNKLHKEWYDWTMKSGEKPAFLEKHVACYVVGSEKWRYADTLEGLTAERRKLFLGSGAAGANDVFQSGWMTTELDSDNLTDEYIYDPLDTRFGELELEEKEAYVLDQTRVLNLFGNGLVYHSQPFEDDTEITGFPKFSAWISINVPDTDFRVTLFEILPDGSSIELSEAVIRARYRQSLREETLIQSGEILEYTFDNFMFFSRMITKGSRLRLLIQAPNSIWWQKNYNSAGDVMKETAKDAHKATITLHHSEQYPTCLEIPIGGE